MSSHINITEFRKQELDKLRFMSGSVAELGERAGTITWANSTTAGAKWEFLKTEEDFQEFREWVKPWGGWTEAEIAAWSPLELNTLLVQWIAGDLRETGLDQIDCNLEEIQAGMEAGRYSSNLYWQNGEFFFSLEH